MFPHIALSSGFAFMKLIAAKFFGLCQWGGQGTTFERHNGVPARRRLSTVHEAMDNRAGKRSLRDWAGRTDTKLTGKTEISLI